LLPFSLAALLAISSELFSLYQLKHNLIQLFIPIALAFTLALWLAELLNQQMK
jgi:hypothetical protein